MHPDGLSDAHQRLEDYTRRVAEIQQRAEQAQEQIRGARARAGSPDGTVTVVLAPGGRLESLKLSPEAMRLGHEQLAAAITRTIRSAHEDAAAQTQAALLPLLGETDAMEFLREQVNSAIADDPALVEDETTPQTEDGGSRHDDEDDDHFDGGSFLR